MHIRRPESFFTLASSLEGLCVTLILKKTESWVNDDLWNTLSQEINPTLGIEIQYEPIYDILNSCSIPLLGELSCLTKVTGQPLVDVVGGAKKIYTRSMKNIEVNIDAVSRCVNHVKENFVNNFYLRHHRWPKVEFTENAPSVT